MLPPPMHSFCSTASFLNRLHIFCLSPGPCCIITNTAYPPPQPNVISPSQSDSPTVTFNPLDLEPSEQLPDPADGYTSSTGINQIDSKQTGKIVQTVSLGGMGMAITLVVNALAAAAANRDLYTTYMVIIKAVLFTEMGLSLFSVAKTGSLYVGLAQRRLIFFTLFFVVAACFLRLHLTFFIADVYLVASGVLASAALICRYLCLARPAT